MLTIIFNQASGVAPPPPAAPSNLVATAISSSAINLTWVDNSSNEDGFKVERSTDNATFVQIVQTAANVIAYSDTNLAAGTTYYYRVYAFNAGGNSAFSNVANATTSVVAISPTGLVESDGKKGGYLVPIQGVVPEGIYPNRPPELPPVYSFAEAAKRKKRRKFAAAVAAMVAVGML